MSLVVMLLQHNMQNEKDLYDTAMKGDGPALRRLIADHVNVDCTPYQVCFHAYSPLYTLVYKARRHCHIWDNYIQQGSCWINNTLHDYARFLCILDHSTNKVAWEKHGRFVVLMFILKSISVHLVPGRSCLHNRTSLLWQSTYCICGLWNAPCVVRIAHA